MQRRQERILKYHKHLTFILSELFMRSLCYCCAIIPQFIFICNYMFLNAHAYTCKNIHTMCRDQPLCIHIRIH